MNELFQKSFVKWGLYLGLLSGLLTFLWYVIDISLLISGWMSLLTYFLIVLFMVFSAREEAKLQDGSLSYGQAVVNSLGVSAVYSFIFLLFTALLYNVIDPELPEKLKELTLEKLATTLENFGMSESDIDKTMEATAERDFKQDFRALGTGFLVMMAINFVIGLIVSAFTRKNKPMFDANPL